MKEQEHPMAGSLLILSSTILFSFMNLAAKLVSENIGTVQVVFFRSAVSAIVLTIYIVINRQHLKLGNRVDLLLRGIVGTISTLLYFGAMALIPLSEFILISYSYPLFTMIFSIFILKERIEILGWFGISMGILGVFLVSGANQIFSIANASHLLGKVMALASAILAGLAVVYIRKLSEGSRTSNSLIVYSMMMMTFIVTAVQMPFSYVQPTSNEWVLLLCVGFASMIAQLIMTLGYRYIKASKGVPVSLFNIVLTVILGATILKEELHANAIIGGVLIISGILIIQFPLKLMRTKPSS